MPRKMSEVMPPLSKNIMKAADIVGTVFFITNIRLVNTKFGPRYLYTIDVGDEEGALFLAKTDYRDALYNTFKEDESEAIGPVTLRKEESYYEFVDVPTVEQEEIPF